LMKRDLNGVGGQSHHQSILGSRESSGCAGRGVR
jgi:hypothetical protein